MNDKNKDFLYVKFSRLSLTEIGKDFRILQSYEDILQSVPHYKVDCLFYPFAFSKLWQSMKTHSLEK